MISNNLINQGFDKRKELRNTQDQQFQLQKKISNYTIEGKY